MVERETWATRAGFILAAIGSAVGLGNIWRFPFQTATNGGSAFLLVYLVAVLVIGIPALLGEFVIGRRSNINAIEAFNKLGRPQWAFIGAIGVIGSFWTLSYYSVVGGWVIRFVYGFGSGVVLDAPQEYFGSVAAGPEAAALHALFMLITVTIVALGIEDGIELATKFMVPSIVVLLLGLAVYAFTLPGAGAGYEFYLSPDFAAVSNNAMTVVPAAAGQALFSLSVGFSVMITYASYLGKDDSLTADGLTIAVSNTFVGVLAGLVVIPLLFAAGIGIGDGGLVSGGGGAGAVFVGVTTALADLPGVAAQVVGVVFFGTVLVAALSSSISLLEAVVSYLVDNYRLSRAPTAAGLGTVIFLLGVPSALDTAWLTWFDGIGVSLFLPVAVFLVVLFVGWILGAEAVDELRQGTSGGSTLPMVWLWGLRTVVLLAILAVLALNFYDLFLTPEAGDYYIVPPGL
ncbi:sodium-dependent transporter [Halomarina rubra]|uniref:Sodium-dependent transporter n=1 Tax=Halomarina rubra TaxID=2071873 RepID=A0ABD6B049_9EURY|nr:sodium-dependent transporter [Halomarina rubra]